MDIHDLYFIKKKIEEKIIVGKQKINWNKLTII
jgi:hypothetical protein